MSVNDRGITSRTPVPPRGDDRSRTLRPPGSGLGPTAVRTAAAAAAGLCVWASLPPRGWWWAAPLGVALLAGALHGRRARDRFLLGGMTGLALFGAGLWWVTSFNAAGYVVLALVEAGLWALAALITPPRRGLVLGLPAALVLAEAARARWPLGGFPLASPALGQVDGPLAPAASVGGPLLVTALLALAGTGLVALWMRRTRPWRGAGAVALVVAAAALAPLAPVGEDIRASRVAAVQGGGPRGIPAVVSDAAAVFDRHMEASGQLASAPVDLVVWPEGAVSVDGPVRDAPHGSALSALARSLDATLVAGVTESAPGGRFRNAAVAWSPDGEIIARYEKVHRVPFGEYIPAREFLSRFVDKVSLVPRDAIPGTGPGMLATPAGRLGVAISYEVFFSRLTREAVRAGGSVLLVPTNAASFTGPVVPAQELAAARLRAIETGRNLVQVAPTGYSAVIDHEGRVRARSGLEEPAVLQETVRLRRGSTWYVRLGDAPVIAAALLVLVASTVRAARPVR